MIFNKDQLQLSSTIGHGESACICFVNDWKLLCKEIIHISSVLARKIQMAHSNDYNVHGTSDHPCVLVFTHHPICTV